MIIICPICGGLIFDYRPLMIFKDRSRVQYPYISDWFCVFFFFIDELCTINFQTQTVWWKTVMIKNLSSFWITTGFHNTDCVWSLMVLNSSISLTLLRMLELLIPSEIQFFWEVRFKTQSNLFWISFE